VTALLALPPKQTRPVGYVMYRLAPFLLLCRPLGPSLSSSAWLAFRFDGVFVLAPLCPRWDSGGPAVESARPQAAMAGCGGLAAGAALRTMSRIAWRLARWGLGRVNPWIRFSDSYSSRTGRTWWLSRWRAIVGDWQV